MSEHDATARRVLIAHGAVITVDGERRILEDGAVSVRGARIEAVGRHQVVAQGEFDEVIDARDMVVLPGLIDAHAHAGHCLVRSLGTDLGDAWNEACLAIYAHGSTPEFWHADAALGALERLKFGVTCGVSLLGGGNSIYRSDEPDAADAHCRAVDAAGVREVMAIGPCPPPYPMAFTRWQGEQKASCERDLAAQLATCEAAIDAWHGKAGGRIQVAVVSPSVHPARIGDTRLLARYGEQARAARALSRKRGVLFTQDGHHQGSVQHAHAELDLLGPDVVLSHSTDLGAEEIAILAATNTRVAHNPSAIASIMGRCPVPELLEAGVTVALGSDAFAPDRSADMFRHMQQCMHYHRRHARDPALLPPGKTLEMATLDGARALGLESQIGSIEVGKRADLILVDLRKPHLWPPDMPLYRVVYFANGNDVDTVMVDGEILMRGRKVCRVDETSVLETARDEAVKARRRCGLFELERMPPGLWGGSRL